MWPVANGAKLRRCNIDLLPLVIPAQAEIYLKDVTIFNIDSHLPKAQSLFFAIHLARGDDGKGL
jgi:hypothetical protein